MAVSPQEQPALRELVGLAIIAAAVIASQIILTRIFSFVCWYHYTPLIIGVALLGFGFAGTYLSVSDGGATEGREQFLARLEREALAFALALPLSLVLVALVRFESAQIFESLWPVAGLATYLIAMTIPFAAAGLVVCRLIDRHRSRAGRVYGTDLVASALGVVLGMTLLTMIGALAAVLFVAGMGAVAALLFATERRGDRRPAAVLIIALAAACLVLYITAPDVLRPPPSKEMAKFRSSPGLEQAPFEVQRWHPIARIDVTGEVAGAAPGFGGEISARFTTPKDIQRCRFLFQDGTAPSAFLRLTPPIDEIPFLRGYLQGAPYKIRSSAQALIIGVGGGIDIAIALAHGAAAVTAVEVNPITYGLLRDDYATYCGLTGDPRVTLVNREGRAYVRSTTANFDVIQLSGADTHAALMSGCGSLTEGYLYTVEALSDFLGRLRPGGVLSFSRPFFVPPRETLKLIATAEAALRDRGIRDPQAHIVALGGKKWSDTLISPRPFSTREVEILLQFAEAYGFNVLAAPLRDLPTPWDNYLGLPAKAASEFRRDYYFNVEPATDDRPFFYDYARWRKVLTEPPLPVNIGIDGYYTVSSPFGPLPAGNLLLIIALFIILVLSTALILYPLRRRAAALAVRGATAARVLGYFAALGLAFIAVEITLIQRFQLLLGSPTIALAAVLLALLAAAGLGSLLAERLSPKRLRLVIPLIAVVLIAEVPAIPAVTRALAAESLVVRVAGAMLLTAVPGVLMGMPFPLGIRQIAGLGAGLVPWAWAANGFLSVVGSAATLLVAMSLGFAPVMVMAAVTYCLGLVALYPLLTPGRDLPTSSPH